RVGWRRGGRRCHLHGGARGSISCEERCGQCTAARPPGTASQQIDSHRASRAGAAGAERSETVTIDTDLARQVLQTEAAAILELVRALDGDFKRAVQLLLDCRGRVIVTGIGKSG